MGNLRSVVVLSCLYKTLENKRKMCPCGKSSVKTTELKDVYQCIVCNLIINERLDDRKEWLNTEEKK